MSPSILIAVAGHKVTLITEKHILILHSGLLEIDGQYKQLLYFLDEQYIYKKKLTGEKTLWFWLLN